MSDLDDMVRMLNEQNSEYADIDTEDGGTEIYVDDAVYVFDPEGTWLYTK